MEGKKNALNGNFKTILIKSGMLPVLILIVIGFQLLSGRFLNPGNIYIILQQASINTVLAAGMTFVILTGGIDLSVGAILAVSAMTSIMVSLSPELSYLAVPIGILSGLILGLVNGGIISVLSLPPFIVTLGTLTTYRGIARLMGGDKTLFNSDIAFAWIGRDSLFGVPWLAIIAVIIIIISWFILKRTVLGVWIYSVGGNIEAARLTGINVSLVVIFVYCFSGICAGIGGVMSAARLYAANGLQLGQSYELDAIAAVILGGTSFVGGVGSIWGTLIGALIIAVLSNGLILVGVSDIWQYIIKGLVIIVAVAIDRFKVANRH